MKKIFPFLLIQIGLLSSCQQNKQTDDPEKLKMVLFDFFDGIKTRDYVKMKSATTDEFLLYEDGKIFNNDSLVNLLSRHEKFSVEYTFENFNINVDGKIGDMTYLNRGEFVINDTLHKTRNWLESANFIKINDKWKLEFLHSTVRK